MKKILGLDLGTTSIGWAVVQEREEREASQIVDLGVRITPMNNGEDKEFDKGKATSINATRTEKRGARRNLSRYKQRREKLKRILRSKGFFTNESKLVENGKKSTYESLKLRAKAAKEKVSLEEFARVLLMLNSKRGYKSNRKEGNSEGQEIDSLKVVEEMREKNLTPGQYRYALLKEGNTAKVEFYLTELEEEFDKIFTHQKSFYPTLLTNEFRHTIKSEGKKTIGSTLLKAFQINGKKIEGNKKEQLLKKYQWRNDALSQQVDLEELAVVLQEVAGEIYNSKENYLGRISNRSKNLYLNKETVGEALYKTVMQNPNESIKNQPYYRQDYINEFNTIWKTQANYHTELTDDLKVKLGNECIFYQRPLKSQKKLLGLCQFENTTLEIDGKNKQVGLKVVPKSSPLFQDFRIWQVLNNLVFTNKETQEKIEFLSFDETLKNEFYELLSFKKEAKVNELITLVAKTHTQIEKKTDWTMNFPKVMGNHTNAVLLGKLKEIEEEEQLEIDWKKGVRKGLEQLLKQIGADPHLFVFDASVVELDSQNYYKLWHLLYSYVDEQFLTGTARERELFGEKNTQLVKNIAKKFGFASKHAKKIAQLSFTLDYGSLSAKAIRKILPHLIRGNKYDVACELAGYNHSNSETKKDLKTKVLIDSLTQLPKNSLRNPIVEKVLNQMFNVINKISETYGKPDEIRIELSRELNSSIAEREKTTKLISKNEKINEEAVKILDAKFNIKNPTRNDIIKYRLYQELESNGYKALYSGRKIELADLYSENNIIEIEHIIPRAVLYNDSYSNKTLEYSTVNKKKDKKTAFDFVKEEYSVEHFENYKNNIIHLLKNSKISKTKAKNLMVEGTNLPEGFLSRELNDTRHIAKKAKEILSTYCKQVVVSSGKITQTLRQDWGLEKLLEEINRPQYQEKNLVKEIERKHNQRTTKLENWTKRDDHRHHAMDALTVAFTTHNHIQLINNDAGKKNKQKSTVILENIKDKITEYRKDSKGISRKRFVRPVKNFRQEAKKQLESILISFKANNKVMTRNTTVFRKKGKVVAKVEQLTPRGQLHKETVYAQRTVRQKEPTPINKRFTLAQAQTIVDDAVKERVLFHLHQFGNNPKLAFDGKTLKKEPLILGNEELKQVYCFEEIFVKRQKVNTDMSLKNIEAILDEEVKRKLRERLKLNDNKPKLAFANLDENPIWLNQQKGIQIKKVTLKAVNNATSLRYKKNHFGEFITNEQSERIPTDYVQLGSNHHVAFYKTPQDTIEERLVSFFEATEQRLAGGEVVNRHYKKEEGWEFLFSIMKNDLIVFPNEEFDNQTIDYLDPNNYSMISKYLYRVQKFATKNYEFRHHLETQLKTDIKYKSFLFHRIQSTNDVENLVKVRVNHIGQIVQKFEKGEA